MDLKHSAGLEMDMDGLPSKPKDPAGRLVKWVLLCQEPGFIYGDHKIDIDRSFINRQLAEFERLTSSGYLPPVLREHTRNGERSGDVLELSSVDIDGRAALIGALAFSDDEANDKIKRGELRYISPSFGSLRDDKGQDFDFVLTEVSLVCAPHQKNLKPGSTHILGAEQLEINMSTEEAQAAVVVETGEEEEESLLKQLEARMSRLEASLSEIRAALQEDEEEEGAPEEGGEEAALRERIGALEMERDRAVWTSASPAALTFTADLSEVLFKVWRADKDRVHMVLTEAIKAAPAPAVEGPRAIAVNPFAVQLSEPAPAPVDDQNKTDTEISEEALRRADGDQIKALSIYRALKAQALN